MLIQLLLCGLIGWWLVMSKAFAWQSLTTAATHVAYCRPRSIGLLWLIQAIHLFLWAYRQTWWLVGTITSWRALVASSPLFPRFARFAAVPYLAYPLSCCLLE